jgi:hypothetical protein
MVCQEREYKRLTYSAFKGACDKDHSKYCYEEEERRVYDDLLGVWTTMVRSLKIAL